MGNWSAFQEFVGAGFASHEVVVWKGGNGVGEGWGGCKGWGEKRPLSPIDNLYQTIKNNHIELSLNLNNPFVAIVVAAHLYWRV
ncbi:MAG: hypothetical protein DWQ04_24020 [Chloroflexi bacterium]|nr:MAG: hypothetical protein DWQ04_24020 [Chloroflexota bacterium]